MDNRFTRMKRDEQRVVMYGGFVAAGALWLTVAWAEPMVLLVLPLVAIACWAAIHALRRKAAREKDVIY
jgi:hypothetical protein